MTAFTPDERLRTAAAYVRQGAYFADIGTDHAYLPVFLTSRGSIRRAIAADIVEGPVARAALTVRESGYGDIIEVRRADGLSGMEDLGLTDIAICGMGGELIASILSAAPFVKDPALRLILQPMTHPERLRQYLAENGFRTEGESWCRANGRVYVCLCVSFDGRRRTLTPVEGELGMPTDSPLQREYAEERIAQLQKQSRGLLAGGREAEAADCLRLAEALARYPFETEKNTEREEGK